MENACVCKGTIYTFLAILYISLFYSRILRAQGCIWRSFFPNGNPSQIMYKGYSNENLVIVLYEPASFKKYKYKIAS